MRSTKKRPNGTKKSSVSAPKTSRLRSVFDRIVRLLPKGAQRVINATLVFCQGTLSRLAVWLTDLPRALLLIGFGILLFTLLATTMGCATVKAGIKIPCPDTPAMRKVWVKNGQLSGEDLNAVVENHMTLWSYIHSIQALGCRVKS